MAGGGGERGGRVGCWWGGGVGRASARAAEPACLEPGLLRGDLSAIGSANHDQALWVLTWICCGFRLCSIASASPSSSEGVSVCTTNQHRSISSRPSRLPDPPITHPARSAYLLPQRLERLLLPRCQVPHSPLLRAP